VLDDCLDGTHLDLALAWSASAFLVRPETQLRVNASW
jgi:hypothetical protein